MPGISLVCSTADVVVESLFAASHGSELLPEYRTTTLYEGRGCALIATTYPEYPLANGSTEDSFLCLEGVLYDRPADRSLEFVRQLCAFSAPGAKDAERELGRQIRETDGDFVAVAISEDSVSVYNDYLGRLPLYYATFRDGVVLSRNIDFVRAYLQVDELDPQSVAEYLMFSYPLEERTLYPGVRRLEAGTRIEIDRRTARAKITELVGYNYEEMEHGSLPQDTNAQNLADLFMESARKRMRRAPAQRVLSLSGGMDARNLAGAFTQLDEGFAARTFLDPLGGATADVRVSRQIAQTLGIPWELIDLSHVVSPDHRTMIRMKNGLNCTSMSFILEYFSRLRGEFGAALWLFTGDGAGLFKDVLLPKRDLKSSAEVVDELERFHARLTLVRAANLVGLKHHDVRDRLVAYVEGLAENDPNQKYKHVIAHSYYRAWLFEGEDRNRHYFWSASPFFDPKFYLYVKNCPDDGRHHYRLYEEMTSRMTPALDVVPNADTGRVTGDPHGSFSVMGVARKLLRGSVNLKKRAKAVLQQRDERIAAIVTETTASIDHFTHDHPGILDPESTSQLLSHPRHQELYDLYLVDTVARTQHYLEHPTA